MRFPPTEEFYACSHPPNVRGFNIKRSLLVSEQIGRKFLCMSFCYKNLPLGYLTALLRVKMVLIFLQLEGLIEGSRAGQGCQGGVVLPMLYPKKSPTLNI